MEKVNNRKQFDAIEAIRIQPVHVKLILHEELQINFNRLKWWLDKGLCAEEG